MRQEEVQEFKERLLQVRGRVLETIRGIEAGGMKLSEKESVGELSAYDNHPADTASSTFERGKDLGLRSGARVLLDAVNEALRRLEQGTYGVCERCGEEIDRERLRALPYTTLCVRCRRELDDDIDPFARPPEEDVLTPPFGRSFKDGEDYVGFDGEDSWQAVARYGTSSGPQDAPVATDHDEAYVDADEDRGAVTRVEEVSARKRYPRRGNRR